MNYNQKRSTIFAAAAVCLGQGKKHIEQFGGGFNTSGGRRASSCRQDAGGLFEEVSEGGRADSFLGDRQFLPAGRAVGSLFPSELAEIADRKTTVVSKRVTEGGFLAGNQPVTATARVKDEVEILGLPEIEGVRADPDEQASACSSSFGYTESYEAAEANDSAEVQSAARYCNGALPSVAEDRRKKALNMDWKNYRRNIEWRCRWLDLRIMELQRRSTKYDEVISEIRKTKAWDSKREPEGAVRAAPVPEGQTAQPLLHRHKRRKVEETVDISDCMSKHPLFQRYEKKKRENEQDCMLSRDPNDLEEADLLDQDADEAAAGDEDSAENILLKVETMHARVIRLRNQLRGSMSHKLPGQIARAATTRPAPKATSRLRAASGAVPASAAAGKGSQITRRRASDYDINNVVMPVTVGAKYVEHVKHANIETPQWRLLDKVVNSELGGSSSGDEDTDDETYKARHEGLEARERQNRYVPRVNKKTADGGETASSKSKASGSHQMMQCSLSSQFSEA